MGLSEKHIPRTIYGRLNAKMMIDQWVRGLPHFQRQTPRIRFDVVTWCSLSGHDLWSLRARWKCDAPPPGKYSHPPKKNKPHCPDGTSERTDLTVNCFELVSICPPIDTCSQSITFDHSHTKTPRKDALAALGKFGSCVCRQLFFKAVRLFQIQQQEFLGRKGVSKGCLGNMRKTQRNTWIGKLL